MKNINWLIVILAIIILILIFRKINKNDRRVRFSKDNKIYFIPNREDLRKEMNSNIIKHEIIPPHAEYKEVGKISDPAWLSSEIFNGDVEGYQKSDMVKRGIENQEYKKCKCQYDDLGRGGYCAWQKDDHLNPWMKPGRYECPRVACGIDCNTGANLIENNNRTPLINYPCYFEIETQKLLNIPKDIPGAPLDM